MHFSRLVFLLLLVISCTTKQHKGVSTTNAKRNYIRVVNYNNFNANTLNFICESIRAYFNKPVLVTNSILNKTYINTTKGTRYNANAIIDELKNTNDSILTSVGITHHDIFTSKKDDNGQVKKPESTYAVWGVFGLGYMPGKSCVVSDFRLFTNDKSKYQHRIRTVVLHEIGHNLGLPHCPNNQCIMSDANEKISTVDNSSTTMCKQCEKTIGL